MGYEIITVTPEVQAHFTLVIPHVEHKIPGKFQNPHIEKIWANRLGPHNVLYQVHVKTGHLGNHHHYSVLFDVHNGNIKLLDVHEGHKTLF